MTAGGASCDLRRLGPESAEEESFDLIVPPGRAVRVFFRRYPHGCRGGVLGGKEKRTCIGGETGDIGRRGDLKNGEDGGRAVRPPVG